MKQRGFVWLIDWLNFHCFLANQNLPNTSINMNATWNQQINNFIQRWMVSYPASELSNGPLSVQVTRLLFIAKGAKVRHNIVVQTFETIDMS